MESYKKISGFERYSVSDAGNVRNDITGVVLSKRKATNGYLRVNLRLGNEKYEKPKVMTVHRLVAEAFIPNVEHKEAVNHIDGNKENNTVSNLEWVTNRENTIHAIKHNLMKPNYRGMNKKARIRSDKAHRTKRYRLKMQRINADKGITKKVAQINPKTGEVIAEYDNCFEAARRLFGEGTLKDRLISRCARGVCKSAYGFWWRYLSSDVERG